MVLDVALILSNALKKYKAMATHITVENESSNDYVKQKIARRSHHWCRKLNMPIMRTVAYTFDNKDGLFKVILN